MKRWTTTAALAAAMGLMAHGGEIKEHELTLTTGANSNATASLVVEKGVLDWIKVDCASSAATGNVTVAIQAKTSTESDETLVSLTANAADTLVVPFRWYTSSAGAAIVGTNAPASVTLCDNIITASVTAVSTVATGKTWRIIARWTFP